MMKNGLTLILLFASVLFSAQSKLTSVLIVKKNGDSIRAKMKISIIPDLNRAIVEDAVFYRKIEVLSNSGEKLYTIRAKDVKELSFYDTNVEKRIYHKDPNKNQLMALLYNGRMKLYKQFVPMTHFMGYHYYFQNEDGTPYKVGLFENNAKILLRITASKPEFKERIEKSGTFEESMIKILHDFENS